MSVNRFKALFATTYSAVALVIALVALVGSFIAEAKLSWAAVFLTVAPYLYLFLRTSLSKNVARTSRYLPIPTALSILGFVIAAYEYSAGRGEAAALLAAGVGCAGFLLFNFWYSSYGRRLNPLLDVGNRLPSFSAEDHDGEPVSSEVLLGRPALIMFFRGNWCPFCLAQVKEITSRYKELIDRGVSVTLISPQPHGLTKRVAEEYGVPFNFWVDTGNHAAEKLQIAVRDGVPAGIRGYDKDTVMPTVIITDADGNIIYTDQTNNYRVRPNPDEFLRALSARGL